MKNKIKLSILFVLIFGFSFAQNESPKVIKIKGEAQVEWNKNYESYTQAKKRVQDLATVNALEQAFGVVVVQGNSTYIKNVNTGEKTETHTSFNMIGNTVVKGEVIEILDIKFKDIKYKKRIDRKRVEFIDIKCDITLKAKEITNTKIDIKAKTLACTNVKCATTAYKNGDEFFIYFNSPEEGYLTIYFDDTENTIRLLPYMEMPEETGNNFKVEADKDYILFSDKEEFNYFEDNYFEEDTYELYAKTEKDLNRIFIIFSKKTLNKPRLKKGLVEQEHKEYIEKGYEMPLQTDSESFQKWLVKTRSVRDDVQVEIIDITIEE